MVQKVKGIFFYGNEGKDTFENTTFLPSYADGGEGADKLTGGSGPDVLIGGFGDDKLYGKGGNDVLRGGFGDDEMYGGKGDDYLDDVEIVGDFLLEDGNDHLYGGPGKDTLYGRSGNDVLDGADDGSWDILWGGSGADQFQVEWFGFLGNRDNPKDYSKIEGDTYYG